MTRKIIFLILALTSFFILGIKSSFAVPNLSNAQLSTPGTTRTLVLPPAAEHAPVISLGSAVDPATGKLVEGYAFIHRKEAAVKPVRPPRGGTRECYAFLGNGAKWKTVEPWVVNPTNTRGLVGDFVLSNLSSDITKWEDAADGVIDNVAGADILGSGTSTDAVLAADLSSPDNQNEAYFADISTSNAIAVTVVWGIFSGPPFGRELVEWDQIYDDVDYDWSASGEAGKMDFANIATHELGHSVGLADLYETVCSEQTMYGYSTYGETKKQTLESGDIAGVNKLY